MRRPSSAPVRRSDPKTSVHSPAGRLVVTRMEPRSYRWLKTSKSSSAPVGDRGTKPRFVDDQQAEAGKLSLEVEQTPFIPGLHQLVDQGGGRRESNGHPLLAGGQAQPQSDVGLAGAAV